VPVSLQPTGAYVTRSLSVSTVQPRQSPVPLKDILRVHRQLWYQGILEAILSRRVSGGAQPNSITPTVHTETSRPTTSTHTFLDIMNASSENTAF
jgi:hypothetical protein